MIVLTLAIPTYNRAEPLRDLLECLCAQRGIDQVQVLISDNGSADDTKAVVDSFGSSLQIKLVGFAENRGFDSNYVNCVTHADGEYLWIVGDDDLLTPGAVEAVLGSLRQGELDILVCNGGDYRGGALVPRVGEPIGPFCTVSDLMSQVGWHLCWIGTFVVRRRLYRPESLRAEDRNAFVHLPLLVHAMPATFSGTFVDQVLLHTTVDNSPYSKNPNTLIRTFGKQLFETLSCLGDSARDHSTRRKIVRSFHDRLSMFALGDFLAFRKDPRFNFSSFMRGLVYFYRVNPLSPLFAVFFLIPVAVQKRILRTLKVILRRGGSAGVAV